MRESKDFDKDPDKQDNDQDLLPEINTVALEF
jgi:hypothetical protein